MGRVVADGAAFYCRRSIVDIQAAAVVGVIFGDGRAVQNECSRGVHAAAVGIAVTVSGYVAAFQRQRAGTLNAACGCARDFAAANAVRDRQRAVHVKDISPGFTAVNHMAREVKRHGRALGNLQNRVALSDFAGFVRLYLIFRSRDISVKRDVLSGFERVIERRPVVDGLRRSH